MLGRCLLEITYANRKLEKLFSDYDAMSRKIPAEWVRNIKKCIDRLRASDNFGIFMKVRLQHHEALSGNDKGKYSVHVSKNARLIMKPSLNGEEVELSTDIEIQGVKDYHGGKDNWYIK